jgi:Bacterial CdiA-CT RNAse A domain
MASKAGCIVFGAHGSDSAAAGLRQVWTGRDTDTLTQQGTTKLAEAMKVSPDMADNIGLSLDIAVSVGVASSIKAVRASEITMGRIKLVDHEARDGSRIGGHTIDKHVGKDKAWLQARLARETELAMVTSFRNLAMAEWAISQVMQQNASTIRAWAQASNGANRLPLVGDTGRNVGYGLVRKTGEMIELGKVRMFLQRQQYNGMPYYIITAYLIK